METSGISANASSNAWGNGLVAQSRQAGPSSPQGSVDASAQNGNSSTRKTGGTKLTIEQQRQVAALQQIDRSVRAHEQAHISAGRGVVTSAANFSYTYGPDGKQYAVGGEVGIDTSAEKKPEANIDKGIRIQAAALAPRDPSSQDYRVASVGSRLEAQGRSDLARQQSEAQATAATNSRQRVERAYSPEADSTSFSIYA
jgi:hypothetical protein